MTELERFGLRAPFGRRAVIRGGILGGAGLAAAVLIGCGDDDEDDAAPATQQQQESKPEAPAVIARPKTPGEVKYSKDLGEPNRTPKAGGTLKLSQQVTFPSIDPAKNAAADPAFWHGLQSSQLLQHDASPAVGFFEENVVADIAQSWEQRPSGLEFVFKLNPKAKWNDRPPANGRAIKASDVKWTYERYAADGLTKARFSIIDKVEAVDDATVRIMLKTPVPEVLDVFAFEFHPILNPEYLDSLKGDMGSGSDKYVGSGPFLATQFNPRVDATWTRNPTYFGVDKGGRALPYLERITWKWINDPAARRAAFESGDIDSVAIDDLGLFDQYAKRDDVLLYKGATSAGESIFALNHRKPPANDDRVRRAVSMAIDRAELNKQIYQGISDPALPLPPRAVGLKGFPGYDQLPENFKFKPDESKKLLDAAGHRNGIDLGTFQYWFLNQAWENQALLIQDMLKKVGITTKLAKVDRSPFLDQLFKGSWEGALMQHATNPGVQGQAWVDWIETGAPNNYWGISDPELDAMIKKVRSELQPQARIEQLKKIQEREVSQVHRVWINQLASITAWRRNFVNPTGSAFLTYKYNAHQFVWSDK